MADLEQVTLSPGTSNFTYFHFYFFNLSSECFVLNECQVSNYVDMNLIKFAKVGDLFVRGTM